MKMKCLNILLLSCFIISAFGKIEYSKNDAPFYTQELKSTSMSYCNNKTGLSCPRSIFDRDNRMLFCGWRCPHDTLYRCKEDADHGMIEFCAKQETCDKGQMNRVYFDDKHQMVVIQKDTCPEGLFQPFEEDCFTACTKYRHIDESFLPERGIAVLYHGNSTNAGVGYCDVDRGYVNMDNKMYINLTQYEVNSACDKLDNYENKCGVGQRLLPDSRCVPICEYGYVVNKEDFFKCSLKSNIDAVITSPSSKKLITSTESGISLSKHITSATESSTTAQQLGAVPIILIAGSGVIFVALGIYCIVKCCCQKNKKAKGSRITRKCKNMFKGCKQLTVNAENGVVNINIDGEAAKAWTSIKTLPADVESDGEKTSLVESGRRDEDPVNNEQTMMELKSFGGTEDQNSDETAVKMVME